MIKNFLMRKTLLRNFYFKFSQIDNHQMLFTDQSELSALPAGYNLCCV